jgi:hypothetical protein
MRRYEQYGFVRSEFVISVELDTPEELQSLISERRIMSESILTIPCIFKRWFVVPIVDIFNELQFTEEIVMSGKIVFI